MTSFTEYAEKFNSKVSDLTTLSAINQNIKCVKNSPGNEIININSNILVLNKFELVSPEVLDRIRQSVISPSSRRDVLGTPIVRGRKKHRVTFQDHINGRPFEDITVVESFKVYNAANTYSEGKRTEDRDNVISDCCVLF